MAFDEQLADRVREAFDGRGVRYAERRMMGGLCFMVDGKMCVGVEGERLMARVDPDGYDAALLRRGCVPMDFTGRPMRGFVFVERDGTRSAKDLDGWLTTALEFNPRAVASKSRCRSTRGKPVARGGR
jgi:hypothetical protein